MSYGENDTHNVDQTLTPRVRTIFRSKAPAPPPVAAPVAATSGAAATEKEPLSWHHLVLEILESLFPFPEAYTVVRQTMDAFGAKLPAPA
jgi:hypothetical protein